MTGIKEKAAFNSVLASAGLAAGKFVAALMTGSLGLLSDALHALLDVGATLMTYFAVRISAKPADDKHQYGHGKIEAVAALIETGLLFVAAAYVSIEAIGRLRHGTHELTPSVVAYVVLGVSIVADVVRSRSLLRVAKETKSEALAADALHFGSDLISSSLVLAGLVAAQYGYAQGDTLSAMGVAIFIGIAGCRLGKRTIDTLMDAVPEGLSSKVRALAENAGGVASVESVRVRATGPEVFGDLGLGVARTLSLERVAAIKANVTAAIHEQFPDATVTITISPKVLDDETVLERVLHVAAVMRRPVHHITVQRINERLSASLDLEIDGRLPVSEGYAIASQLERAIARELGPKVEVETHLEPLVIHGLQGHNVDGETEERVTTALKHRAAEIEAVRNIHNVRVRNTESGLGSELPLQGGRDDFDCRDA
jgi:cation diffusion facilitator family transporter